MSVDNRDVRRYFDAVVDKSFASWLSRQEQLSDMRDQCNKVYYVDSSAVCSRLHFIGRDSIEENQLLYNLASKVLPQFSRTKRCLFRFGSIIPLRGNEVSTLFGGIDKAPIHAIVRIKVERSSKCLAKKCSGRLVCKKRITINKNP